MTGVADPSDRTLKYAIHDTEVAISESVTNSNARSASVAAL